MNRSKTAFTLVELLVVITIIGLLVALLIPAVNAVREKGRQTVCRNNQQEIGKAMLSYEQSQRQLPGVMNKITSSGQVYSWAEALFPDLERNDLWQQISGGTATAAGVGNVRVNVLVCPDDPILSAPTSTQGQALLSYGVNDQFFVDYTTAIFPTKTPPMDRNGNTVGPAILSDLKTRPGVPPSSGSPPKSFPRGMSVTTTQIVMLGDRTWIDPNPPSSTYAPYIRAGKWTDTAWNSLAFPWPGGASAVPISPGVMASTHAPTAKSFGTVVVVTYFDGHSAILPSDTPFPYTPYP